VILLQWSLRLQTDQAGCLTLTTNAVIAHI